jgi:predicted  nucleic acid-binding Zn-ribbon protein
MVGLYYALETRTSVLENEARALQTQINDVRNRVNTAERKIKRLTRNQP